MALRMRDLMDRALDDLRYEPTDKWLRAVIGRHTVIDSKRALLVWEPRRVVPSYAVPVEDVHGELVPATPLRASEPAPGGAAAAGEGSRARAVRHPGIRFAEHSTAGEVLSVGAGGVIRAGAAFQPEDPDLAAYVVLDFRAFDAWYEEEERVVAHPRDPFKRIDVLESSRHVRVEIGGQVLAESSRPYLLFETHLPVRFYLRRADLRVDWRPSERRTYCAYKGEASYLALKVNGAFRDDLVWTYESPLRDAAVLTDLVAFFNEKVDIVLDGELQPRPDSPFSSAIVEGAGV